MIIALWLIIASPDMTRSGPHRAKGPDLKAPPSNTKAFSGSVSEAAQVELPLYFMGRWGRPQYVACFFLFSAGNRDILRIDSFLDVFSHTTWNTQMHFSIGSRELNHRFQQSLRHPV
jgi:hypothetical protein